MALGKYCRKIQPNRHIPPDLEPVDGWSFQVCSDYSGTSIERWYLCFGANQPKWERFHLYCILLTDSFETLSLMEAEGFWKESTSRARWAWSSTIYNQIFELDIDVLNHLLLSFFINNDESIIITIIGCRWSGSIFMIIRH